MRKTKGFTLVELLTVVAIIAMLLSVLIPSLQKARGVAQRAVCANNFKTIALADLIYAQESDDWHVPLVNGLSPDNELWFQNKLFVKIVALKGRYNPEAVQGYDASTTLPWDFRCPTDKRTVANKGLYHYSNGSVEGVSYGMNGMSLYPKVGGWYYYKSDGTPGAAHALRTFQVVGPSAKFFFMDAEWYVVHRDGANYKLYWDKYGDRMGSWFWDAVAYRHSEGANVVFYDGHLKYMAKQQVYITTGNAFQQRQANNQLWLPIPGRECMDPPPGY
jgi:prepilin-type N-terminal cleavage/methylation domain-containing protein/prepilin-type processing-associated H-X9-DG protein